MKFEEFRGNTSDYVRREIKVYNPFRASENGPQPRNLEEKTTLFNRFIRVIRKLVLHKKKVEGEVGDIGITNNDPSSNLIHEEMHELEIDHMPTFRRKGGFTRELEIGEKFDEGSPPLSSLYPLDRGIPPHKTADVGSNTGGITVPFDPLNREKNNAVTTYPIKRGQIKPPNNN